ncbi:MAG: PepSY domain-containing protein [Comamonadaceae bacterium]|nr:PepSY domain-containing protein [Comamonadaceae bacterium]
MNTVSTSALHALRSRRAGLGAAALLAAALLAGPAQAAGNASQALQAMADQGYVAIHDLEFKHQHWTAEATTQGGTRVQLLLDGAGRVAEVGNPVSHAQIASVQDVLQRLHSLGYQQVHDVEMDDGFWTADAINRHGVPVELTLHPVTLELLGEVGDDDRRGPGAAPQAQPPAWGPQGVLPASEVIARLQRAGYRHIHDLDFDDGYWEAEAINPAGFRVDLRLDPRTGAVLREKYDD